VSRLNSGSGMNGPSQAAERYQIGREGERAVAHLLEKLEDCKECKGTGFAPVSQEFRAPMRRCRCQVLSRSVQRFNEANIPAKHAHSSMLNFEKDRRGMMQGFMVVSTFIQRFRAGEENRGLILCGDVGLGKTHLIAAIIRELVFKHQVSAKFVEFSHLLADLKSGFDKGVGASRLLDPLVQVNLLAIDELGKGRNTEFEGTVLDELVSRRYNSAAPILGTTNYLPGTATGTGQPNLALGPENRAQPTLADRVGPRVFSRLSEMCDFVTLQGEDYRIKTSSKART
jgi:DNA replication protein DnaC